MSWIKRKFFLLIALFLVYTTYFIFHSHTVPSHSQTLGAQTNLSLLEEPRDGKQTILQFINSATKQIDMEIYLLSDKDIIKSLLDACQRGVLVRVMLEEHPFGGGNINEKSASELQSSCVHFQWTNPSFALTHEKTVVIDKNLVLILTQNLTESAFTKNREYDIVDTNPTDQQKADPVYIQENDAWLAAEASYKNQQNVIAQTTAGVTSAWLSYEQDSGVITAPIAGVVGDITVVPGMQIAANTSTTTVSSQTVASIKTDGKPIVSVTLSELDAVKVKAGQKATVTFDALPNQTFTGRIAGINTAGIISSGVTTYPATIVLDNQNDSILSNMSATADIITDIHPDVLLVPSSAVSTSANGSTVRVLQNNQPTPVNVTVGESSDTETEITSGLTEGQTVIVGTIAAGTSGATSPFSGGLRIGGGGGFGGAVRTGGR